MKMAHSMLEGMAMVAKAHGAKVKVPRYKSIFDQIRQSDPNYVPTLEEALAALGGAGAVLRK